MSNASKDWLYEQSLLTRKEHIEEDLYYEFSQYYKGEKEKFIEDIIDIINRMMKDDNLH